MTVTGLHPVSLIGCADPELQDAFVVSMVNEHIVIVDELADHSIEPTRVSRRETIRNRVKGIVTELVFYDEGFLRVCQTRKGKGTSNHLLELRFLDPDPVQKRINSTACLWSALGSGIAALLVAVLMPMTGVSQYAPSATAVLATLAVVTLLLYVYRSESRHLFATANGRAVVLVLRGSFGCIRRSRLVVDAVRHAIATARRQVGSENVDYLRSEMKAHYSLAATGVISRRACSHGTTLILSRFD